MSRYLLSIAVTALLAAAPAAAVIVTSAAGAPDPGIAAGETLLVSFDTANVAGVTDIRSGNVITAAGSIGSVRAAPAGTLSGGIYRSIGTGGASLFDFSAWTAGRGLGSVSFYWGSIDTYNFVDILDGAGAVLSTIGGGALPLANGNQQLAASNRRVFFTFAPAENAMALRLRSTGNAFEFDSIAAQAIPGAVPEPATWAMLIAGFGMVGFALRRRKVATVAA
jgi:hypothetical protein